MLSIAVPGRTTYSHLAMRSNANLDATFHALSDATRRTMIQALARRGPQSAGELGAHFDSAQPTISKHLKVLEEAGLVDRYIHGRTHHFSLLPKPLSEANRWLDRHQAFWESAAQELDRLLAKTRDVE
jgi:DNA-binding transcriptional ArsR family regulator